VGLVWVVCHCQDLGLGFVRKGVMMFPPWRYIGVNFSSNRSSKGCYCSSPSHSFCRSFSYSGTVTRWMHVSMSQGFASSTHFSMCSNSDFQIRLKSLGCYDFQSY